jgi:hypothetical protein
VVTTSTPDGGAALTPTEIRSAPPTRSGLPLLWLKPDADPIGSGRIAISLADLHRSIEPIKNKAPIRRPFQKKPISDAQPPDAGRLASSLAGMPLGRTQTDE